MRIAATADLHYGKSSQGALQALFVEASTAADVLLLCGDLTDYGLVEEARALAHDIQAHARIPVLAVLGNHDYESGHADKVTKILVDAGVTLLDGECHELNGVGFVGVCGFGGGFGSSMLNPWGEPLIKAFVQEAVDQAMRLERALARVETTQRVVLLHYAPIRETVVGENPEVFAFMGSTRLEGPLNRHHVTAAFHGHAHHGSLESRTSAGVPVYNVSLPLLKKANPARPWFRLLELEQIPDSGSSEEGAIVQGQS
ncbi:metallophosphoesterase [Prosthecobacter sp.]|uniref:metallophosphoesterase family protein n=1 Tax=Prosthecobacter sp. TaxID=1965333 RepID=UPI002ABBA19D|nr:metallophosphoesterase [Prosthecobacter sp.]MDZ4402342.1 metallophosphoesterase [Prosthecobacter sp.]